jgi:DNA-binding beta-propeller fold protein YncE
MRRVRRLATGVVAVAGFLSVASIGRADQFDGTLYFTRFSGTPNVESVGFHYNSGSHALTYDPQHVLASVNGADGIMFAPNGNLLVTSNSVASVYRIDASTGSVLQTVSTGIGLSNFHMALDPSGTQFYSSNRYQQTTGPLSTYAIAPNGTISNATTTAITGPVDTNVTQLAFAPNGKVLYTDGTPNSNGTVGLFTLGNPNTTDHLLGATLSAHGVVYDPFTGLWTMFGGGAVGTLDPNAGSDAAIAASLKQRTGINVDFDQGSVDGFGHALIAGNNQITFIDYSQTHDITSALNTIIIRSADNGGGSFTNIDDVAPLVGLGSQGGVPEPASCVLLGVGGLGLLAGRRLRRRRKA